MGETDIITPEETRDRQGEGGTRLNGFFHDVRSEPNYVHVVRTCLFFAFSLSIAALLGSEATST